jgi:hypothetical protein
MRSIVFAGLIGLASIPVVKHFVFMNTVQNVQIIHKERIVTKDESKYLIFTDSEVFENTDSILAMKFRSTDFYRDIKVGDTCTFTVTGIRWGFASWYRNIIDYSCKT